MTRHEVELEAKIERLTVENDRLKALLKNAERLLGGQDASLAELEKRTGDNG